MVSFPTGGNCAGRFVQCTSRGEARPGGHDRVGLEARRGRLADGQHDVEVRLLDLHTPVMNLKPIFMIIEANFSSGTEVFH